MMQKLIKNKANRNRSKKEMLKSIERGAKSASLFLKGKIKLENAKDLLNEWHQ